MARVRLDLTRIEELADLNYVRAEEVAEFQRAHDFLLRVRNELHFISPRATDVMSLDQQPRIAEADWPAEVRQRLFMREGNHLGEHPDGLLHLASSRSVCR